MAEGYAAALTERAIPAEQALRLAIQYIKVKAPINATKEECEAAYAALRANPLAAKMLEE